MKINLNQVNKRKLPDFLRYAYWCGFTAEINGHFLELTRKEPNG